jgi:LmbE family N-acetylglucosaminyl deacetylase
MPVAPAVVVSPHLDDAVLSASMRLAEGGAAVVTVFAGVPAAGTVPPVWDRMTGAFDSVARMRERLAEDDEALARLGQVPTLRLDELDGQYRNRPADPGWLGKLLAECLAGAGEIWLPSAVGGNPDHAAVRDAALAAADAAPGAAVYVYADFPYITWGGGWPSWVTGIAPEPYLDVAVWLEAELRAGGFDPDRLEPVVRVLDDAEQARKRHAMDAYRTQLPALGLDSRRLDTDHDLLRYELAWRLDRDWATAWPPPSARRT